MRRSLLVLALAGLAAVAAPAAAQTWGRYDGGYSSAPDDRYDGPRYDRRNEGRRDWNTVPSSFDWRGQLDRPGDYRCDPFWDANRTDCGARWRDQRRQVSSQARRDYRRLAGSQYDDGYGRGHDDGRYSLRRRGYGYGSGYGHGYGHDRGGAAWEGAYGRPDIVFPGGGYAGDRDPRRVDWCRANYRSYDPVSGYYRAYSGRLVFCG